MAKTVWTGGYEGVCQINKDHRFHTDTLGKMSRTCCGRPIDFTKTMHDIQVTDDEKPTDKV